MAGRRVGQRHLHSGRRRRRGNSRPSELVDGVVLVSGTLEGGAVGRPRLLAHEGLEAELLELHLEQNVRLDPVEVIIPDRWQAGPGITNIGRPKQCFRSRIPIQWPSDPDPCTKTHLKMS